MAGLIADSGAIYGLYDADDQHHSRLRDFLASERGAVIIPVAILSEIDYLLQARLASPLNCAFSTILRLERSPSGLFTSADVH